MPVFIAREGKARQLPPDPFRNEKELQHFFEHNLDSLLGIRFVASEFGTGQKHAGRIDTLGLDEAGNPVIIEYKWDKSESVINQGLFYLDWLIDHRGDFTVAAQRAIGQDVLISWSGPRLVIVAAGYTKYDSYAVNQLSPNIELLRYRRYSEGVVVVESVLEPVGTAPSKVAPPAPSKKLEGEPTYDLEYHLAKTSEGVRTAFLDLRDRILALDGVEERVNQKVQITYRTTKSFVAFDFKKAGVNVQFKGGEAPPSIEGVEIKDIRSYQWGYPWMCHLQSSDDVDPVFEVVKSAYALEQ
jgi:hypothetical protein